MGTFNVTCCVTKTPILKGEKCVLVVLNNPNKSLLQGAKCFDLVFQDSIKDIFFGKNNDYGRMNSCPYSVNDERENEFVGFFISRMAWDFGKTLKYDLLGVSNNTKLAETLTSLEKTAAILKMPDSEKERSLKLAEKYKCWMTYKSETRSLFALESFCSLNNFNMFDVSFNNFYAGQVVSIKEMKQWNKLRHDRIKKLKK